jgi:hypothetical protein
MKHPARAWRADIRDGPVCEGRIYADTDTIE